MAKFWYAYNGVDNPFNATSYSRISPPNTPNCLIGSQLCAIYANGSVYSSFPSNPLSSNIREYVALGFVSGQVPQPSVVGEKYYVYLKN